MNKAFFYLFIIVSYLSISNMNRTKSFEIYQGGLIFSEGKTIDFGFEMVQKDDSVYCWLVNASERLALTPNVWRGDTLIVEHPVFDSKIVLTKMTGGNFVGYFQDNSRQGTYRIPLSLSKGERKNHFAGTRSIQGRWACVFDTDSNAYPAIGEFVQTANGITGTFLTETGDYRYLQGGFTDETHFKLSCFDGSHAFLFEGTLVGDTIEGIFYSGTHFKTVWKGNRNDSARLTSSFELTKPVSEGPVKLAIPQPNGNVFNLDTAPYKGKPVVIQIMGSWCPNCMDETRYLTSIYDEYHRKGLQFVALCFERVADTEVHLQRINKVRKNMKVPYEMILAGTASKGDASKLLPFLSEILSFPTTIFLNGKHEVIGVHTGFNGPGTGLKYIEQSKEFEKLLQALIRD
jgi:thiol-disulfide isomerase/thioredoxin